MTSQSHPPGFVSRQRATSLRQASILSRSLKAGITRDALDEEFSDVTPSAWPRRRTGIRTSSAKLGRSPSLRPG